MAKNEIYPFGTAARVENGDCMELVDYAADPQRESGHQLGIARRELENTVLRQTSHMSAGLAQFIANRYKPGVLDDGDLGKIEAGLTQAIAYIAVTSLKIDTATTTAAGLVELATRAEAEAKSSSIHAVTPASLLNFITQDASTGAAMLPVGTTDERPAKPTHGMIRYNTTLHHVEWYNHATAEWLPTYREPMYDLEYLVIAGGGPGGGAARSPGGGGGAGGYRSSVLGDTSGGNTPAEAKLSVRPGTTLPIIVGAGGAAASTGGTPGGNSSLGDIIALGGGAGSCPSVLKGGDGGSGSGTHQATESHRGHATQGQGCDGGLGASYSSGAGGGAGAPGGNGQRRNNAGKGGEGLASSIDGTDTTRAGGGGGSVGGDYYGGKGGDGGAGGGGTGSTSSATSATPGAQSTGSGGGAGHQAASGGSGLVIIRYKGSQQGSGGTITSYTDDDGQLWTVHTFTTSGVFTA